MVVGALGTAENKTESLPSGAVIQVSRWEAHPTCTDLQHTQATPHFIHTGFAAPMALGSPRQLVAFRANKRRSKLLSRVERL